MVLPLALDVQQPTSTTRCAVALGYAQLKCWISPHCIVTKRLAILHHELELALAAHIDTEARCSLACSLACRPQLLAINNDTKYSAAAAVTACGAA